MADAGYDPQKNHQLMREQLGIESIIPPRAGRPTARLPTGRCGMAMDFDDETYGQRWQVEPVMSMLKRHQVESLTLRN